MHTRTVACQQNGQVEIIEKTLSDPEADEIQVKGAACGICSLDIANSKSGGRMVVPVGAGHEGNGYIVKVGAAVKDFQEGERVCNVGFATYTNIKAKTAYKIPDSQVADEHFLVEPVACALTGIAHCHLKPGDKVAVIGAGFMGLLMIQGLGGRGLLGKLIAIDINRQRLEMARPFGAHEVYDAAELEVQALKEARWDVVVDTSGTQTGLDLASELVRAGGIINLFGWIKSERACFDPTRWHLGGFTVINSSPASRVWDPFPAAIKLIAEGVFDLRPLVTHIVSLDEYPGLIKQILAGDPSYLKGVVKHKAGDHRQGQGT